MKPNVRRGKTNGERGGEGEKAGRKVSRDS